MATKAYKVDGNALTEAVELLNRIEPTSSMQCSEIIKFTAKGDTLYMQLTSDASGVVHVKGEGEFPAKQFFIDRDIFFPFVLTGKRQTGAFTFRMAKTKLVIKHGPRQVICTCDVSTSGYGSAKQAADATEVTLSPETFQRVKAAQAVSGKNDSEPELTCVYLDGKGRLLATDGLLMVVAKADHKGAVVPIPNAAISLTALANEIHVGKSLTMVYDAGRITHPVPADALTEYPVDMFRQQLKAMKGYPVQINTTVGKFDTVVENLAGAGAKMNKKTAHAKIQYGKPSGVRSTKPQFKISMFIREKEATIGDKAFDTCKTSTTDDTPLILPVSRLADVAKLFVETAADDKQPLTLSWTATSNVVAIRSGDVVVIMARIQDDD